MLIPRLQEVSDMGCDTGSSPGDLKRDIPQLFANDDLGFDLSKIDLSAVTEGWNVKVRFPSDQASRERLHMHSRQDIGHTKKMQYRIAHLRCEIGFSIALSKKFAIAPLCFLYLADSIRSLSSLMVLSCTS